MTQSTAYAALLLRLALGTMFIAHALLEILVFTPAGTAGFFEPPGVPGWFGNPAMGAALIGGAMLVLGVQTRAVSLALLPILIGSIVLVHGANGWLYTDEHGGRDYSAFLIVASVVQVLLGDGAYRLSSLLGHNRSGRTAVGATA